jgi:hypothetical protein
MFITHQLFVVIGNLLLFCITHNNNVLAVHRWIGAEESGLAVQGESNSFRALSEDLEAPIRINCGGHNFTTLEGDEWIEDAFFTQGTTNDFCNLTDVTTKSSTTTASADTNSSEAFAELGNLYCTYRFASHGPFQYDIPVPNGKYKVRLHFAESWFDFGGYRVFDVMVQNTTALSELDLAADYGKYVPAVIDLNDTVVSDGTITIRFVSIENAACISGIEIHPTTNDSTTTAETPLAPVSTPSTQNSNLPDANAPSHDDTSKASLQTKSIVASFAWLVISGVMHF